jgi:bifunctional UDP-N-acetylglucosamine pyrophosphorylase/glucosamine-1-phosphate N-acetyltransferase
MRNQIVILAAGKGTRMGNGGIPKVLVMLKNKPLILYVLHEIEKINQLAKPVIVVGYQSQKVQAVLGDQYLYAYQDRQLGTAHAVMAAKHKAKADNLLVLYGDMPFIKSSSLKKLMRSHHGHKAALSMFTATVPDFCGELESLKHFGRIIRDVEGNIVKITEYKDATEAEKRLKEVNPGIYMFNAEWLWRNIEKIKNQNAQGEYYLTDMVEVAIKQGSKILSLPIDPVETMGVNTLAELQEAEKRI